MKENEKRGAPRIPYITEVVCEGAGTRLIARTSDLSASGVFIHSKLCCEPGSILRVKFVVNSAQIETVGEVCYSMPQVGMGIRFIDLKPEDLEVIETYISRRSEDGAVSINTGSPHITPSGVGPVDELLGGLDRGHLYLAHGDASGKSLFGIQFLIEGLRNGQRGALITTQARVDAVRRFTRLSYDCLADIRRGSLVLFRSSPDLGDHVLELGRLEPLLRELEPVLAVSCPDRIVFDPVNNLLSGRNLDDVNARADELSVWLRSFGATVVLVANGESVGVIESLTPLVKESFRFGVRESRDRVIRFIAFEKSASIPDQTVRVDPSRGISLVEHQQTDGQADQDLQVKSATDRAEPDTPETAEIDSGSRVPSASTAELSEADSGVSGFNPAPSDSPGASQSGPLATGADASTESTVDSAEQKAVVAHEEPGNAFFAMLNELHSFVSSLDPDGADKDGVP